MNIDERTLEQARNADLIAFLKKRYGFTFAHRGGAYRCQQHQSLAVKDDRRSWFWHSKAIGGYGALDFLKIGECMSFRQAVETITGIAIAAAPPRRETEPPKTLILPEKAGGMLKLYDYLCMKRGIEAEIVHSLIQKEMLYEDKRGNVVFVGYDGQGKARFASLRGTHGDFRGDCAGSDKRYCFNMASPDSGQMYIFESAIDCMSHASMEVIIKGGKDAWTSRSRLSLSGTSDTALLFFLNQHKAVRELVFCLDNDPPGREAAAALLDKYAARGYSARIEPPLGKDYNDELLSMRKAQRLETVRENKDRDDVSR